MSEPKTQKPSTPDTLTKAGKDASIELSESELNKVHGGSKVKTSDKQQAAVLAFVKG